MDDGYARSSRSRIEAFRQVEKRDVCLSGEKWLVFHLRQSHQASVSRQLFEASIIPALRIKPMKKGQKVIERETSWERPDPFEICKEISLQWPTMQHLREFCATLFPMIRGWS